MTKSQGAMATRDSTVPPETLAELFFYLSDPERRQALEKYRIEFEALNGPTDVTKRYTSTWPKDQQDWLYENHTQRWFDGLPPFARAYLRGKAELAARDGRLDDFPDKLLDLFVSGGMRPGHTRSR